MASSGTFISSSPEMKPLCRRSSVRKRAKSDCISEEVTGSTCQTRTQPRRDSGRRARGHAATPNGTHAAALNLQRHAHFRLQCSCTSSMSN